MAQAKLDRFKKTTVITLATGLGSGYSPVAPGTAGSVVGIAAAWLLAGLGWPLYLLVTAAIFVSGVWAAGIAEEIYQAKDSGRITVDEVAGMLLTVAFVPPTLLNLVAGFFLFRFFDITKPFPAGKIDASVGGGLGVMLDDVVAGIYANICLQALRLVVS